MKLKKTLLGVTAAVTMSAAIACAPADEQPADPEAGGAGFRGAGDGGYHQDGTARGLGRDGLGRHQRAYPDGGIMQGQQGARGLGGQQGMRGFEGQQGTMGQWGRPDNQPGIQDGIYGHGRGQMDDQRLGLLGRDNILPGMDGRGGAGGTTQQMEGMNRAGDRGGMGEFGGARQGVFDQETSDRLEQRIERMDDVQNAEVIIHDNDIIVGVQAEDGQDGDDLENKIESHIEDLNVAEGKQVHVSTDADALERMTTLDGQLRDGQPIRNAADEIGDLIEQFGRNLGGTQ